MILDFRLTILDLGLKSETKQNNKITIQAFSDSNNLKPET